MHVIHKTNKGCCYFQGAYLWSYPTVLARDLLGRSCTSFLQRPLLHHPEWVWEPSLTYTGRPWRWQLQPRQCISSWSRLRQSAWFATQGLKNKQFHLFWQESLFIRSTLFPYKVSSGSEVFTLTPALEVSEPDTISKIILNCHPIDRSVEIQPFIVQITNNNTQQTSLMDYLQLISIICNFHLKTRI